MNLVFDMKERRPACAILQVVYGGDVGIANLFNADSWLIDPTPDMKCYSITQEQLDRVVKKVNEESSRLPK